MYTDEEVKEKIEEYSKYYKIGDIRIKDYYDTLCEYPFYSPDDEGMYCLEQVCQSRALTAEELKDKTIKKQYRHTVEFAINDAIYNTYEEGALPYLSEEYIKEKNLQSELRLRYINM